MSEDCMTDVVPGRDADIGPGFLARSRNFRHDTGMSGMSQDFREIVDEDVEAERL